MSIPQVSSRQLSRVYFFKNAKVDPKYEDVVLPSFFPTNTEALFEANFGAEMRIPASDSGAVPPVDYQYIRIEENKVRVDVGRMCGVQSEDSTPICHPNDLYECNYMVLHNFGNVSYSDLDDVTAGFTKREPYNSFWYCCFLNNAKYLNDSVIEFEYEVDIFNTYWCAPDNGDGNPWSSGQYEKTFSRSTVVHPCFVEREHSNTDAIGDNLIEENLELGDYTVMSNPIYDMNEQCIGLLATEKKVNDEWVKPEGITLNNIYTPLHFEFSITGNTAQDGQGLTNPYIEDGKEDDIVALYQFPKKFMSADVVYDPMNVQMPNNLDGYVPKNKKLLTYPYSLLVVTNNSGESAEYKWEQWQSGKQGQFTIAGTSIVSPSAFCYPIFYRGKGVDYDSGIPFNNFAMLPFAGDAFKAYWAQNKTGVGTRIASSIGGLLATAGLIGAGFLTGGSALALGATALTAAGTNVASTLSKFTDAQRVPSQAHGECPNNYLASGMNRLEYTFNVTCIRAQFARVIDDYFTAYGYATHRVKVPNFYSGSSRPNFCYVKCQGAKVTGKFPAPVKKQFEDILNRGVRFWKNYNNYLNLNVNNSIS